MNRREMLKVAAGLAVAAVVPTSLRPEVKMPIGDLFAKLGAGEKLSPAEQNELRLKMNNQEALTAQFNSWSDANGNIDPNLFQQRGPSAGFSVLPNECASIYNGDVLTASSNGAAFTTLVGSTGALTGGPANWSHGMRIDSTAGIIYLDSLNRNAVVAIWASVTWSSAVVAGTDVSIQWNCNDGAALAKRDDMPTLTFGGYTQQLVHFRQVTSGQTSYFISAGTNAATAQNLTAFLFGMARIY